MTKPCRTCPGSNDLVINTRREGEFKIEEDGALLFEKLPSDKPGYTRDPANKLRLKPTHLPCQDRITMPLLERTGLYVVVNKCNHTEHPVRGQEVTPQDCRACPLRNPPDISRGSLERL